MDNERITGPIPTRRVVGAGILVCFLIDVLGHAYSVFQRGLPVTVRNIATYAHRAWHSEAFVVGFLVCCLVGTLLVGQIVDFWVKEKNNV